MNAVRSAARVSGLVIGFESGISTQVNAVMEREGLDSPLT